MRPLPHLVVTCLALALMGATCSRRPASSGVTGDLLPATISTDVGTMNVEERYLPGVVDCEIAYFTAAPAALDAQAIAARTYLARWLSEHGPAATVPIGPHFQCWREPVYPRSAQAARRTRGVLLRHQGQLISGNYAAGASKLDDACTPPGPDAFGYDGSWDSIRRAFVVRGQRLSGPAWTEIFVTRNGGRRGDAVEPSRLGPTRPWNRGALGQHAAICLAERRRLPTAAILRHFYGDDIAVE